MEKQDQIIQDLVAKRNIAEIIQYCEEIELDSAAEMTNAVPPYSVMLLAYMIVNDMDSCRFLWKRIPNPSARKKDNLLQAIWAIGKCIWARNYEGTFAAITAYRSTGVGTSIHNALVDILYEEFVSRTKLLIATTYQSISVKHAASLLGLSETEAAKLWPEQDGFLFPVLPSKPLELTTAQNINSVAEFAVHLETDISTFGLKHANTGKSTGGGSGGGGGGGGGGGSNTSGGSKGTQTGGGGGVAAGKK